MNANKKANEIFEKMYSLQEIKGQRQFINAQRCGTLLCEEIVGALRNNPSSSQTEMIEFWNEVNEELNKL